MAPLPLPPGPVSNGEFIPAPAAPDDDALLTEIRSLVGDAARAAGMDRRRFLQSAGGVAASLAAFNLAACSRANRTVAPPAGSFTVPTAKDVPACQHALGGRGEFIVDVHTHHVMPDGPWRHNAPDTVALIEAMLPRGQTSDTLARFVAGFKTARERPAA